MNKSIKETNETTVQQHVEQKRSKHGMKAAISLVLGSVLLIGGSFAYFTDYAAISAEGTSGTLSIALDSDINLLDAEGRDILNPGDIRDGGFTVTNMGNKSADIRTTIALTAYDRDGQPINLSGNEATQSEYDLYLASDVEYVEGYGHMPKEGVRPLQNKVVNGNIITYSIPEYSLNGNSDLYDEVETLVESAAIMPLEDFNGSNGKFDAEFKEEVVPGIPPTPTYTKDCDFVFLFSTEAGNDWQGSVVRIDVIVEAKQHENTSAGWDIVAQENLIAGSLNQNVVLPENVITTNGTINDGYEYIPSVSCETTTCTLQGQVEGAVTKIAIDVKESSSNYWDTITTEDDGSFLLKELKPNTEYNMKIPQKMSVPHEYNFTTGDAGTITKITIITSNLY